MAGIVFLLLSMADAFFTRYGLMLGATELNPFPSALLSNMAVRASYALVGVFFFHYFDIAHTNKFERCIAGAKAIWAMNAGVGAVVVWNIIMCLVLVR